MWPCSRGPHEARMNRGATASGAVSGAWPRAPPGSVARMGAGPRPFTIAVPDAALDDLRRRLAATRWPQPIPGSETWDLGTQEATLRRLAARWADGYDWRAAERALNALPHFVVDLDGAPVHYVHLRGASDAPSFPLVLTHGWPGSFLEHVGLAQRLAERSFDVVVPSLPGFGFSAQRPQPTDPWSTPALWQRLMADVLGYARYGAHGGDLGAGVATRLAARHPEAVVGLHLTSVAHPGLGDDARLSDAERAYVEHLAEWDRGEGAYLHQQQTRPVTLAYGLSDSPVGMLAWLVEKYRGWSDSHGDLGTRFGDDDVLTWASLYWHTNAMAPSFRPYHDGYARPARTPRVTVPTAVAVFPGDLARPPRAWAERTYDVRRYTVMPRGGHFAAWEEPDLLADDIAAFFAGLR
jgi:pimeloyl-ACP methyl ester carboxylesterase